MEDSVKELLSSMLFSDFSASSQKARKRKIIFWYDPTKAFMDNIDELQFDNTEILKYDNNSLWIRYHIEKEELNKNIIIYLPIERSTGSNNNLLDLETANPDLIFNPDKTNMKLRDLGLPEECRSIIKKYMRFFNNKTRETEFLNFDIEDKNTDNIDYIVTSILLGIKTINIDDIMKAIIKAYFDDKKKLETLCKFGSEEFVIKLINNYFGCKIKIIDEIDDVLKSLVFTYFAGTIENINKLDRYGKYLLSERVTNSQVFVNSLMRDKATKKYFELISNNMKNEFGIDELLNSMDIEEYKNSDAFDIIDKKVINFLIDQLFNGINDYKKYNELISIRESKYWFDKYYYEYNFLKVVNNYFEAENSLQKLLKTMTIEDFVKLYADKLYILDTYYRKTYYFFDKIADKDNFINLKNKLENNYINTYMIELSLKWNDTVESLNRYDANKLLMQNKFFNSYIKPNTENARNGRTIVIISDAFRYECAKELVERLNTFANKVDITYMLGLVPSYTQLGMASLLPNKELRRDPKYKENKSENIIVDGMSSVGTENRQKILQNTINESIAIQYDELNDMKKSDWKKLFSGTKVVYIYHNVIDKAGEHDDNSLFDACEKAIEELEKLVRDLHTTFSGINCYITADHGFFYKRSKVENYQKAEKDNDVSKQKTRFSYSDEKSKAEGIMSVNLDYIFGKDSGYVNIPKGFNVYSKQGGGVNYVHGGILPQEVIIPVINFKSTRTTEETQKVSITYSGLTTRITNAITYLEFLQDNNIDEEHLPCRYLLHFEDEEGNRISDETTIVANYTNTEVKDRFFREKFVFKNIKYDKTKNYYLVITEEDTGIIRQKIKFIIDITIINNFGF